MSIRFVPILVAAYLLDPASSAAQACPADCDRNGRVEIAELIAAVGFGLGQSSEGCPAADQDGDGSVGIAELIAAVNAALDGCRVVAACEPFVIAEAQEVSGLFEQLHGPAIAMLRDGSFAIAWSRTLGGFTPHVEPESALEIQWFDATGLPRRAPIHLPRPEAVSAPHIAFGSGSRLFAAWGELRGFSAGGGTFYNRALAATFDAGGTIQGDPVLLGDGLLLGVISDLDADREGRAAVLFPSQFTLDEPTPVLLQRLASRAQAAGPPLEVAASYNPRMQLRADGTAAVVVTERVTDLHQELRLYVVRPGGGIAAPVVVAADRQYEGGGYEEVTDTFDIAMAGDRHAVVVWLQDERHSPPGQTGPRRVGVYARRVDLATGALEDTHPLPLESFVRERGGVVRVAATPEGDFAVLLGAALQRFTADGSPDGGPFPAIEGWEPEAQDDIHFYQRGLGMTADGDIVVALSQFLSLVGRRLARADRHMCEVPYAPTPTRPSTPTVTPTLTVTATRTPPATRTATPTYAFRCGDGIWDESSCADCPADCTPRPCVPSGETVSFTISVDAATGDPISQLDLRLAYRTDVLSLPGTGNEISVRQRVRAAPPIPSAFTVDDLDYAARVTAARTAGLGDPVASARFDRCVAASAPDVDDLACFVERCAAPSGARQCRCTVAVTP